MEKKNQNKSLNMKQKKPSFPQKALIMNRVKSSKELEKFIFEKFLKILLITIS